MKMAGKSARLMIMPDIVEPRTGSPGAFSSRLNISQTTPPIPPHWLESTCEDQVVTVYR